jgi:DNA-3-methyladenine glycosylase II
MSRVSREEKEAASVGGSCSTPLPAQARPGRILVPSRDLSYTPKVNKMSTATEKACLELLRRASEKGRTAEGDSTMYAPEGLTEGIAVLTAEPFFAGMLARAGPPRFRRRRNGFGTLLHIILEQQVSIDAAAAMHKRLVGLCRPLEPATFLALDDATLRSCGFSRQKMGYGRQFAEMVGSGSFDFARLAAADDEAALAELLSIRGIGRWSAEIYLLFALGRADIWPAADLGLQVSIGEEFKLGSRPGEIETRRLGEAWRPWRSVAACLFWQTYLHARRRTAPLLPSELYA